MSETGADGAQRGYIATLLGAYAGALVIGGPVAALSLIAVGRLAFTDVPDAVLIAISTVAAGAAIFGSGFGAARMLLRRRLAEARSTGILLGVLLTLLFLVGVVSSGTEVQSSWFVPLAVIAVVTPLPARWIALARKRLTGS